MSKIKLLITALLLLAIAAGFMAYANPASPKLKVVIFFPGGPESGKEGTKIINQFIDILGQKAGYDSKTIEGSYFTDIKEATAYIGKNKDAFIVSSPGFFVANRKNLNLVPLAKVKMAENAPEKYYLAVKKEKYQKLEDLKGKTLSGSTLYEDPQFLSKIVFQGKVEVGSFFALKPTSRPLDAIRKVSRDQLDAVLLNRIQHHSLAKMPLFKELEIIYASPEIPPLGFMMVETAATKAVKDKILGVVTQMCQTPEGEPVCKNFGIEGFEPISQEAINEVVKKFEGK